MPRSMTGFGRGEATGDRGRVVIEAKAVNNRFSEVAVRLPRPLVGLEDRIKKMVQGQVARGRVDVYVSWEAAGGAGRRVQVDKDLALAYYNALKDIGEAIGSKIELSAESLVKLPDVLVIQDAELDLEELWATVSASLVKCLAALVAMREREGAALTADLLERAERVGALMGGVADRAPQVVAEYRLRLERRLAEVLGQELPDPGRLAQEVALFADRCDISEEIQRLESHLAQFRSALSGGEGPGTAVGRKLDFLVQELFREVNTIGSKAQDIAISHVVVDAKAELEKIREQVQNLE